MEVINTIAIIIIPLGAVLLGQWLQNRSEKRKDKRLIISLCEITNRLKAA